MICDLENLDHDSDLAKEEDKTHWRDLSTRQSKCRITNSFPTGHWTAGSEW